MWASDGQQEWSSRRRAPRQRKSLQKGPEEEMVTWEAERRQGGRECWERRTGRKCGWKVTWGPNPIDLVGPSKVLRLKMPGPEWGGGSEFKQGCDMICSFVRYKEWIKTGTVGGQWQNYNNNSPGEVCWCLDQWWWRWGEVDCSGVHPGDRVFGTSWCLYILSSVTNKIGDLKKKLRYHYHIKLYYFQVYNMMIWNDHHSKSS